LSSYLCKNRDDVQSGGEEKDGIARYKSKDHVLIYLLDPVRLRRHVRQAESGAYRLQFQQQQKLAQLIRQIQILRKGELETRGRSIPYVNLALHGARALLGPARGARAAEEREVLGDLLLG
jgi:hypothetical protein